MRDSKIVWDERTLDAFLRVPTQAVPGTSMGYAGIKDARECADLLAWLRQAAQPGKGCTVSRCGAASSGPGNAAPQPQAWRLSRQAASRVSGA